MQPNRAAQLSPDELVAVLAEMTAEALAGHVRAVRAMAEEITAPISAAVGALGARVAEIEGQQAGVAQELQTVAVGAGAGCRSATDAVARLADETSARLAAGAATVDTLIGEVRAETARAIETAVTTLSATADAQWKADSEVIEDLRQAAEASGALLEGQIAALDDEIARRQATAFDAHDALRGSVEALGARLEALDRAQDDSAGALARLEVDAQHLDAAAQATDQQLAALAAQAEAAERTSADLAEAQRLGLDAIADDVAALMGKADDSATIAAALAERIADLEIREAPPGEPGLDRPVIDMVATWGPETAQLPKGCLVTERGSLFLSTREAHGPPSVEPSSWLALAAGAHIEGASYDGERDFGLSIRSGHEVIALDVPLPVPIHRGTWAAEQPYAEHDCVTWDGAVWRADAIIAPGIEPGTEAGAGWVIMIPRGKTGRPGKDGGRGLAGPEGRGIAAVLEAIVDDAILFELSDGSVARVDLSPLVDSIAAAVRGGRP
jgi:hypothetical protein